MFYQQQNEAFIKNEEERRNQKQIEADNSFLSDLLAEVFIKKNIFSPPVLSGLQGLFSFGLQ